jgi:S1-C subfamily serine protease
VDLGVLRDVIAGSFLSGLRGLDVVLITLLALVTLGGLRRGLLSRLAAWFGFLAGLILAGRSVPLALSFVDGLNLPARTFVAVFTLSATITTTTVALQFLMAPFRRILTLGPLSVLDRALGAAVSAIAFAAVLWLLIPLAASIPGTVSSEVRASRVLGQLDASTPAPPDVTRTLRTLLGGSRFPDVFAALAPSPSLEEPPAIVAIDPETVAIATAGTARISVVGCGRSYSGSGFAIDGDVIVTNAHVVAGGREVEIVTSEGRRQSAQVIAFDPDRDLALLSVPGHGLTPLRLSDPTVETEGAVIGYPGGQELARAAPARIDRIVTGLGRDIYGRGTTERSLLTLAAELRGGDSGAPLIDARGDVIGIVFAVSPDVPTTAYALATDELRAVIAGPREIGFSGRCI